MWSYLALIKDLQSGRHDCPVCGNKNTLSITREGVELLFYCFHASCGIKGRIKDDVKIDTFRTNFASNISNAGESIRRREENSRFLICNGRCINFLNSYNISGIDLDLRYDPKQDRIVFPLTYKGQNYGYVGRALDVHTNPKWYIYSRLDGCPYTCHTRTARRVASSAILVEDCISALRVSSISNAIALLGTNCPGDTVPYLLDYDKLYIALDDDATGKAIKLQQQLAFYRDTKIIPLTKDIKYFSENELEELRIKWLEKD